MRSESKFEKALDAIVGALTMGGAVTLFLALIWLSMPTWISVSFTVMIAYAIVSLLFDVAVEKLQRRIKAAVCKALRVTNYDNMRLGEKEEVLLRQLHKSISRFNRKPSEKNHDEYQRAKFRFEYHEEYSYGRCLVAKHYNPYF